MILEIKHVEKCRNGADGNFYRFSNGKALITISLRNNKLLCEYMATVLHEMLHCYTTIIRRAGFRTTDKLEHKWIEDCERAVIREMKKHFQGRK